MPVIPVSRDLATVYRFRQSTLRTGKGNTGRKFAGNVSNPTVVLVILALH
jgi:hypothetical protein